MSLVIALLGALRASLRTRTDLALENLALRQRLVLLRRRSKRPQSSIVSSGCGSPPSGLGGARRSMSFAPDRDSLAPARLPRFLDLEVTSRTSASRWRIPLIPS
jgi:hypothetical protein